MMKERRTPTESGRVSMVVPSEILSVSLVHHPCMLRTTGLKKTCVRGSVLGAAMATDAI